ncbi:unnamed protein product [Closterium sp. Naga37s-1]|nr:unnamed protein product [Closterium sp. Naga37s-1]
MLVVKDNRAVSLQDLTAAVTCFPHLSHVHLSDNSVESIDDAFLAHLAAACPKLVSLHVGKEIMKIWDWEREREHPVTEAGLDRFLRRCTQLQHLSLYCLHRFGRLPASLSLLTDLHTLAVTHSAALEAPGFTNLSSLATLSVDKSDQEELDLSSLVHLPAFANLSLCGETELVLEGEDAYPVSFAHIPFLESLEFNYSTPRLPESFGRLPVLRELSLQQVLISGLPDSFSQLSTLEVLNLVDCRAMVALPARFGSLHALKSLCIANSPKLCLPEDIGGLTDLHTLRVTLNRVQELLPCSFTQLKSLTRLELTQCGMLKELPEGVGWLSNLCELSIRACPKIRKLPETVTNLASLEVLRVEGCSRLSFIPGSLSALGRLKELAIGKCAQLPEVCKSLPPSLETLSLGSVQRLTPLIELPALTRLRCISLTGVALVRGLVATVSLTSLEHMELALAGEAEELPLSLAFCPNLRTLTIRSAARMKTLPHAFGSALQQLRQLRIEQAAELRGLPETVSQMHCLTSLEAHAPKLASLPDSIGALSRLRQLNLAHCSSLTRLPASLTRLSCLHKLNLGFTAIRSLPCNFAQLSRLKALDLESCTHLESLPDDFTQLQMLHSLNANRCDKLIGSRGCLNVEGVPDMYGLYVA